MRSFVPTALASAAAAALAILLVGGCAKDRRHTIYISVADQRMAVFDRGVEIARYPVSTSKFGEGDTPRSCKTPLGRMEVAKKIGSGARLGTVFKHRQPTGEVLPPDAPGRDPIVTRILWLKGLEAQNRGAYDRYIYIHGTVAERDLGKAVSYGCIRMASHDVLSLYDTVGTGAQVYVMENPLTTLPPPPQ